MTFTCNATGVPLPTITWSSESNGAIMPQSDEVIDGDLVRQSQIMIPTLQLGDFEIYTCTATNEFDSDSEMASLQCKIILYRKVWQQWSLANLLLQSVGEEKFGEQIDNKCDFSLTNHT